MQGHRFLSSWISSLHPTSKLSLLILHEASHPHVSDTDSIYRLLPEMTHQTTLHPKHHLLPGLFPVQHWQVPCIHCWSPIFSDHGLDCCRYRTAPGNYSCSLSLLLIHVLRLRRWFPSDQRIHREGHNSLHMVPHLSGLKVPLTLSPLFFYNYLLLYQTFRKWQCLQSRMVLDILNHRKSLQILR